MLPSPVSKAVRANRRGSLCVALTRVLAGEPAALGAPRLISGKVNRQGVGAIE